MDESTSLDAASRARRIRSQLPGGGLFAGHTWRIAPHAFAAPPGVVAELESLGRVLLQFYRALNLLYRQSAAGKQPAWIAEWLDQGKPKPILDLQRDRAFKNELPRIIRPDVLLTENKFAISELDSIPGGIGLTAWLNQTYADLGESVVGGRDGMVAGFTGLFAECPNTHVVIAEESATYRPEMEWLCHTARQKHGHPFHVRNANFDTFSPGDGVYRFFELFDLANVPAAAKIFDAARANHLVLTPPPKAYLEEKMGLALLWNRNLEEFWRQNLGSAFLARLRRHVPYTWVVDPTPLPPQAAIPQLELTDWHQLKSLSQRERELILKVSGFSERAWGARGVFLGSDLSQAAWSNAVDEAIREFGQTPFILQRYHKPRSLPCEWFNFDSDRSVPMQARVRLCPYYFIEGKGDASQARLRGILATACPADKKIIHGMRDAIIAPVKSPGT